MAEAYDQLSDIAPTVLIDYGTKDWQEVTTELGSVVGHEDAAKSVIDDYENWVDAQAEKIEIPQQPVTALVYLGSEGVWAFSKTRPKASYSPASASTTRMSRRTLPRSRTESLW